MRHTSGLLIDAPMAEPDTGYESHFVTAQDGLLLHARIYGGRLAPGLPIVCLPGLARHSADFHALASALASDRAAPRRTIAIDYRGRGRSQWDRNPRHYTLAVELADVLAMLTALALGPAIFVGTSRGGILTMLLAAARPAAIAGAVLNDIGPLIEATGLARIKGYVGKLPQPRDFADAAAILRRLFGAQFPKLSDEDWLAFAQRTFVERDGALHPAYDPALAHTLDGVDLERKLPTLWNEFDALAGVPLLAVRGANSDLLAADTLAAMRARRSAMPVWEVPDQGHAPLLSDAATIGRIKAFAASCEAARRLR